MKLDALNVLLIEDNPGDADLINEMLAEQQFFKLLHANCLETGRACLKKKNIV